MLVLELGLVGILTLLDYQTESQDIGDIFVKAEAVAIYAGEKLININENITGQDLSPPTIQANSSTLRLYLGRLLILQTAIIGLVILIIGLNPKLLLSPSLFRN